MWLIFQEKNEVNVKSDMAPDWLEWNHLEMSLEISYCGTVTTSAALFFLQTFPSRIVPHSQHLVLMEQTSTCQTTHSTLCVHFQVTNQISRKTTTSTRWKWDILLFNAEWSVFLSFQQSDTSDDHLKIKMATESWEHYSAWRSQVERETSFAFLTSSPWSLPHKEKRSVSGLCIIWVFLVFITASLDFNSVPSVDWKPSRKWAAIKNTGSSLLIWDSLLMYYWSFSDISSN